MIPNARPRKSSVLVPYSPPLAAFALLAGTVGLRAQPVLTAPPPVSVTPPALAEFQAAETGLPEQGAEQATTFPLGKLLTWGPVTLHPHFYYSLSHADGLLASPGC